MSSKGGEETNTNSKVVEEEEKQKKGSTASEDTQQPETSDQSKTTTASSRRSATTRGGKGNRKYRKRGHSEDETEDSADGDEPEDKRPIKELIEETRELQKMRQRYKGVDLTVTESSAAEAWLAARESSNDATVASLGATFTLQSTSNPIDQQLERYIQERMKKSEQQVEEPKKKLTDEDLLYAVPDNLKANREVNQRQPASTLMTGIVEVELPIEYKLKNIEATEAAKRQMEDAIKSGTASEDAIAPPVGNAAGGGGNASGGNNNRGNKATDDLVLERFKKRFRY
eukprot:TRINITY_DN4270_c0_g1_i1.p1 TRINITY_DN4270_c0_g1~~TRINITY_DN4270_c0_g1_i1.p1  ORF type:complete len:286 (+),score=105.08 TRINITY_DN4270_c0_g1_i1:87-944(+)